MINQSQIFQNKNVPKQKCFQSEVVRKDWNFQIEQNKIEQQQQQTHNNIVEQNKCRIKILSSNFQNQINNQTSSSRNQDFNQTQSCIFSFKMPISQTINQDQQKQNFPSSSIFNYSTQTTNQDSQQNKYNMQQQFFSKQNEQKNFIPHQQQFQSLEVFEPQNNNLVCNTNPSLNLPSQIAQQYETEQDFKLFQQQKKEFTNFDQQIPISQEKKIKEPNYSQVDQSLFERIYQQRPSITIPEERMQTLLCICWNCNNTIQQQSIMLNCFHRYHIECIVEIVQNQIQNGQILIKCICQKKIPYKQIQQIVFEQKQDLLQILDKSIFNNLIKQLPKSVIIQDQINFSILK